MHQGLQSYWWAFFSCEQCARLEHDDQICEHLEWHWPEADAWWGHALLNDAEYVAKVLFETPRSLKEAAEAIGDGPCRQRQIVEEQMKEKHYFNRRCLAKCGRCFAQQRWTCSCVSWGRWKHGSGFGFNFAEWEADSKAQGWAQGSFVIQWWHRPRRQSHPTTKRFQEAFQYRF